MNIKPGYRTSEFWMTVVTFIFSGLYLIGILKENDQKEELIQIVSHGVESCILIGGQLIILYKYIKGRSEIKKIAESKGGKSSGSGRKTKKSTTRTNKKESKQPK